MGDGTKLIENIVLEFLLKMRDVAEENALNL